MSTLSLLVSPVSHVFCVSPSASTIFWCLLLWMISFQPRIIIVFPFFSGWSDKFSGVSVYLPPRACLKLIKPQNPNLSRQNPNREDFFNFAKLLNFSWFLCGRYKYRPALQWSSSNGPQCGFLTYLENQIVKFEKCH